MIRPYTAEDQAELLALIQLNIPEFFAASEAYDFAEYLDHKAEDYFVVEENGKIIGSGGVNYFPEEQQARISWDIIHPEHQGKGVGTELTLHRIEHIKKQPGINEIVVRTSQVAYRFYKKIGFELVKTEKDFWAEGFDLYQMRMKIQ